MALTDEEIQQVMAKRKEIIEQNEDTVFYIGTNENRKYYTIIEIKNETTQGIAFRAFGFRGEKFRLYTN